MNTTQQSLVAHYRPGVSIHELAARHGLQPSRAVRLLNAAGVAVADYDFHKYRFDRVTRSLTRTVDPERTRSRNRRVG